MDVTFTGNKDVLIAGGGSSNWSPSPYGNAKPHLKQIVCLSAISFQGNNSCHLQIKLSISKKRPSTWLENVIIGKIIPAGIGMARYHVP